MSLDDFARDFQNNEYFVRSLYFDSPSSFNFYEKIDGIKKRKKFRLRTYDKKFGESALFIEQKGRNVNRVFKHRTLIEDRDIERFKELLGDGSHIGINIVYDIEHEIKGIGNAFIMGEEFIGDEKVCLVLGDNIFKMKRK